MESNLEIGKDSQMATNTGTGMNQPHGNEYFTPSIEDIRVGYECEANPKFYSEQKDVWKPTIMKGVGQEVIYYHSLGVYRTLYLTEEQIESEGWKEDIKNGVNCYSNGIYKLFWYKNKTIISIDKLDIQVYRGECRCINDFRYINKLLNIK